MPSQTVQIIIAMVIYIAAIVGIGIWFAKKANKSSEDYFLGGRSLGPWVTAMSAEASDMSVPLEELLDSLKNTDGVIKTEILAG